MKNKIIESNQISFFNRYGISLQDSWNLHDEGTKALALEHADRCDENINVQTINFGEEHILRVVLGFGGVKGVEAALNNSVPTLCIIIWEPNEAFFEAYCTYNDISYLIDDLRINIVIGDDILSLGAVFKEKVKDYNAYHSKAIGIGCYAQHENVYVNMLADALGKAARDAVEDGYARKMFHIRPCKNLLYTINSLPANHIIFQLLDEIDTREIPVIIVSAGPSLMKNVGELKLAKGKALIVAVAHAMGTLHKEGIIPDMVAITDASGVDFLDFDVERKCILLSSVFADKGSREGYDGSIIYHGFNMIGHIFSCERTLKESFTELDTGSVATDVFSIFLSAGFKHIILTGQDLAYDQNGFSHTGGETEDSFDRNNPAYKEVEGIYGGKIRTRWDWEMFREYFERRIEESVDVEVVDATEGGALIKGTRIMTLKDAIDVYCTHDYPVNDWIRNLESGDDEEKEYINRWFEVAKTNLTDMIEYLDEAICSGEFIISKWKNDKEWDSEFRAKCKRYDILYGIIMEGDRSDLLRLYCMEQIQKYVENALILEGDENIINRMRMENQLFIVMIQKAKELLEYARGLRDE